MSNINKAVVYARFSPRPNAKECLSCEKQVADCLEYCDDYDVEVRSVFSDESQSGDDMDRQGLWDALEALKRGDILLVTRHDRLARDVYMSEIVKRAVKKAGARIISIEGNNENTAQGEFIRGIFAQFAEYEKKMIAARTKAGMLRRQRSGEMMSKIPPFGFDVDPEAEGRMKENADEQATIAKMVSLREAGHSFGEIKKHLEVNGYKPRKESWHRQTIKRIIDRHKEVGID